MRQYGKGSSLWNGNRRGKMRKEYGEAIVLMKKRLNVALLPLPQAFLGMVQAVKWGRG